MTRSDGQTLIAPFTPSILEVLNSAWMDWQTQYAQVSSILDVRTRANIMRDHMVHHARRVFHEMKGVRIIEQAGLFLVEIESVGKRAILRFKKFNKDEHTSNYPTQQAQDYHEQQLLPFMPKKAPRLEVGWQPNELGTTFRALIAYPREIGKTWWVIDLLAVANDESIPTGTQIEIPEKKKRVRVKPRTVKKVNQANHE